MPKAKVVFYSAQQKSQNTGTPEQRQDHMEAVLWFGLEVEGKGYGMCVEVSQPYGIDYESETIEVRPPVGEYRGTWNHRDFAELCETYYRSQFGISGTGFCFGHGVQMSGNIVFSPPMVGEFDIPTEGSRAW